MSKAKMSGRIFGIALAILMIGAMFGWLPASGETQASDLGLADSPWPMFHHDTQHTGRSPYTGPETPALKWSFPTGGTVSSSPAIGSDGTIYVGSDDNNLYAINPDGSLKWSFPTGGDVESSPAIGSDGTIYVGSHDCNLYAINPDGSLKWSFPTGSGWFFSSPAIGSDGTIYVGSDDGDLYTINPDGSLEWSFKIGSFVDSSPAIGSDRTVYVGSNSFNLYALGEGEGPEVTFPDPNLEAAIREAINKPTGPIYQSDLDGLTTLDASVRKITDLTGLEHCTSLTVLYLCYNNRISDISPLSSLTSLTSLDLRSNQISDISPLSSLTSLTYLNLRGNQISDISPLSSLTSLTWLTLWENEISDISPLSSLTSLTSLDLRSNQVSDISPLSGLTSLTVLLLGDNQISDISPLSTLTSLTYLDLEGNQVSDIKPLVDNAGLSEGDELDLRSNPLSATSCNDYIPQLQARGVSVEHDCAATNDLTISSTAGGSVTTPGEGTFTYDAGTVVNLVAAPAASYHFVNWTGDVATVANVNAASTTITMNGNYSITANFTTESDTIPPTVDAFSVNRLSVTLGDAFDISYTVSDTGDSGLNRVELWRKNETVDWQEIERISIDGVGNGPYADSFSDAPPSAGTYWYGVHVEDNAGNWNDEQNSQTGGSPGDFGPTEVQVIPSEEEFWVEVDNTYGAFMCRKDVNFRFDEEGEDLAIGSHSETVRYLQAILNSNPETQLEADEPGDFGSPGYEIANFGPLTERAVMRFQELHDLPQETGVVDGMTMQALNNLSCLPVKHVPDGWVLKVTNTHQNEEIHDRCVWWEVEDVTDHIEGWLVYERISDGTIYLNEGDEQELSQRTRILPGRDERTAVIRQEVEQHCAEFLPDNFPVDLVLAMVVQESEGIDFDNEIVALTPWGRGIMQIDTDDYVGQGSGIRWYPDGEVDYCRGRDGHGCTDTPEGCRCEACRHYYTNTTQGIEANIKDGLRALQHKYVSECCYNRSEDAKWDASEGLYREEMVDGVVFYSTEEECEDSDGKTYNSRVQKIKIGDIEISCNEFKTIDAIWRYNGRSMYDINKEPDKECMGNDYLRCVGEKLDETEDNSDEIIDIFGKSIPKKKDWIEKFKFIAGYDNSMIMYEIKSPVCIQVYDSEGRATGLVNGEIIEGIPFSSYDEETGTIVIPFSYDSYRCEVVGTDEGTYGLDIVFIEDGEGTSFTVTDIPTASAAVHQYSIDWDALSEGEKGVTMQIDSDGDGTFEKTITADSDLTKDEYLSVTEEEEGIPIWVWVAIGVLAALLVLLVALVFRNVRRRPPARPELIQKEAEFLLCPRCNAENSLDAKSCVNCGARLKES